MVLSLSLHNSAICRRITVFPRFSHMINNFNDNREKRKKRQTQGVYDERNLIVFEDMIYGFIREGETI